jgi:menaquinol-cytochrome c reductase iron-sulfur subunit
MDTEPTVGRSIADANAPLVGRREFFSKLSLGLSGLFGALVGLPVVGFLVAPLFRKAPEIWQSVGRVEEWQVNQTKLVTLRDPSPVPWAGVAARSAAWVRRDTESQFLAFAINCTHLGCPVRWLDDANLFMCPCHGGVFYKDGRAAAGPPPRPLFQYEVRVTNGQVEVRSGTLPITGD